jgi:hypothetical protein
MTTNSMRCASCDQPIRGKYCDACGEKRISDEDRTLRQMIGHGVEAATNANGKVLVTLRALLLQPGRLTADHLRGRRKPYLAPVQLFLFANLIFFLLHPLIGSNILTTTLQTHLQYTWYKNVAQGMIGPRLVERGQTVEAYATIFDGVAADRAKSLVILVVPLFSAAVAALYWRQRRHYIDHLVFAAHVCTFWLLLICVLLAVTNLTIRLLRTVNAFPSAEQVGMTISVVTLLVLSVYLYRASRAVFERQPPWITVTKAIALGVAFDLSLRVYRFALFFITFWST